MLNMEAELRMEKQIKKTVASLIPLLSVHERYRLIGFIKGFIFRKSL